MNFFDVILGMFVEPSQKVAKSLAEHVGYKQKLKSYNNL